MKERYRILILLVFLIGITLMPVYFIPPSDEIIYIQTNGSICFGCDDTYDPTILSLITVIIPIVILISIIVRYFPKKKEQVN